MNELARKVALAIAGTGIALAAPIAVDEVRIAALPDNLKIKVPEVLVVGDILVDVDTVAYAVRSAAPSAKLPDEVSRTNNTITRRIDDDSYVTTAYMGQPFYRSTEDGEWYDLSFATTSREAFELQMPALAHAADTGFHVAGTIESSSGWASFTTTRLNTSDNSRTTCNTDSTDPTCTGQISDFTFGIPGGATIDGIEVSAEYLCSNICTASTREFILATALSWDDGGTFTTEKQDTTESETDVTVTFGGAADTWGRSWSDTEFADGSFRLKVTGDEQAGNLTTDGALDYIAVKVYYTAPIGNPAPTDPAIIFE